MSIGGDDIRFTTTIFYESGESLTVVTDKQPRAIWKLNGGLYIVCRDLNKAWFLGQVNPDGSYQEVHKWQLPDGPKPWNLENKRMHTYLQEEYDRLN